jgi:hypothetical protein
MELQYKLQELTKPSSAGSSTDLQSGVERIDPEQALSLVSKFYNI